jgi:hypothetical protein
MVGENPDKFKINFHRRTYEDRWTRYRAKVLTALGLSDWEINELKYNRLTNRRVAWFLKDIQREVEAIRGKFELGSYEAAALYRREHYEDLIDTHDIEDWDPYWRMGYVD